MIYLAGSIFNQDDSECLSWRKEATAKLLRYGLAVTDPMVRDYRGYEDANMGAIVNGDKHDICRSKAVLVNCTAPSWGTAMEILFAFDAGKPVFGFGPMVQSPWVKFHCVNYAATMDRSIELLAKWYAP
jgi:nucleoside 2-deoxyribosyltransferase